MGDDIALRTDTCEAWEELADGNVLTRREIPGVIVCVGEVAIVQESSHAPRPCNPVPGLFIGAIMRVAPENAHFLRCRIELGC